MVSDHVACVPAGQVGVGMEPLEDATPLPQVDPVEARHAALADVYGRQREVVRLPGVGLVAVVFAALQRVPAKRAAVRLHPVLAVAALPPAGQGRLLGGGVLLPVVEGAAPGVAPEQRAPTP